MEYPRLGLIRIENFDHFLADAYDQMRQWRLPMNRSLAAKCHAVSNSAHEGEGKNPNLIQRNDARASCAHLGPF
jgi:hypothetical protein